MLRGRGRIYKTNGELLRENSSHGRRVIKLKVDVAARDKGLFPSFMGGREEGVSSATDR